MIEKLQTFCQRIEENVGQVVVGKRKEIRLLLAALLSGGHILLEDVPGVGKTMLARSLAVSLGCSFRRIQCTPDLLPTDITGTSVYDQQKNQFVFHPGPLFAQVVLVDEINRATPRTQSSLLEAMGEGQVTVDGETRRLSPPFLVIATQNPIEYEGTFPLPEAQLDRFFLKLSLGYPSTGEEREILDRLQETHPLNSLTACAKPEQIVGFQTAIRQIHVSDEIRDYIVTLTQKTRTHSAVRLGASPRGSLALFRAAQALAGLEGRDYVIPDDVQIAALPVLAHRLIIEPEQELRGQTGAQVVGELLRRVPSDQ